MIATTLKTTKGKLLVKIPTNIKEVTLGQMMAMQAEPLLNDLDAISILSDIPVEELQNVLDFRDFNIFGEAVVFLSNQIKHLYNSDNIPSKVAFDIDGKILNVNVIRNLSVEPAGAFMAARDIIAEEINEHISLYGEEDWQERFNPSLKASCKVLAQYFYCRVTGEKYNEYKIEEFCETIKKLRVTEALPIAKYFFMSYPNLLKRKTNYFRQLHLFWKRKRAFNRLKSSSI
ncbi:hypothetical protein [Mucilaginibacter sp.]|uniref:hypothetical protein n=1 Tax=Mucilaginibacter sp. TaxID=1882438 RepID=UPI002601C031|nr:hypothetical protein [Mucilaginibacter sp.]MDB5030529.1 hypothetical protein [Mucilaginibacter sp.]